MQRTSFLYKRPCTEKSLPEVAFSCETVEETQNSVTLKISGKDLFFLENEAGGHRFQRIPPTEKRGRVHTSTITVAVLDSEAKQTEQLDYADVVEQQYSGTGKGGQHRNKHANNVRLIHRPSGLKVQVEGREYHKNRAAARKQLETAYAALQSEQAQRDTDNKRKGQVGTGMRGDKVRTVALQRDQVTDHRLGWTMKASKYLKGDW